MFAPPARTVVCSAEDDECTQFREGGTLARACAAAQERTMPEDARPVGIFGHLPTVSRSKCNTFNLLF